MLDRRLPIGHKVSNFSEDPGTIVSFTLDPYDANDDTVELQYFSDEDGCHYDFVESFYLGDYDGLEAVAHD